MAPSFTAAQGATVLMIRSRSSESCMRGLDEYAAFIETHGQRMGVNAVTEAELRARCLTVLTLGAAS